MKPWRQPRRLPRPKKPMSDAIARCFVGFDTSNYTTSAAVTTLDTDGRPHVVANIKLPLPVSEGARGLRQSDAVFAHVKNLPEAIAQVRRVISDQGLTVAAVGYSATPRDAEGSYLEPVCLVQLVAALRGACLDLVATIAEYASTTNLGYMFLITTHCQILYIQIGVKIRKKV